MDDQNSAKLRVCFIRVYVFAFAATFNTVFCFFLANQTSFKDEFFPTAFFIDNFIENYVFKTWVIPLMGFYSSPSKISAF
jgi:hypothetical protein